MAEEDHGHSSDDAASSSKKRKQSRTAHDLPEIEVDVSLPEPPSKRAKRALKKGKPLPPKPSSDDERDERKKRKGKSTSTTTTTTTDGEKEEKPTQYGVWIGNLPFTVTRPQLFQWLVDNSGGAITEADITRVNLPTGGSRGKKQQRQTAAVEEKAEAGAETTADGGGDPQKQAAAPPVAPNKGFAYVDFATYEAQIAAVALSETELDGRRLLIKDSKSFEGRPQPGSSQQAPGAGGAAASNENTTHAHNSVDTPGSTKIFVGNLGFDTTEKDLLWHFGPCGPVAWAKVATFPDNTERCRGYGWVQFGVRSTRRNNNKNKLEDGDENNGDNNDDAPGVEDDDDDEQQHQNQKNTDIPAGASYAEMAAIAAASAVRGFVRIREAVDTEEDFLAEAAGQDSGDNSNQNNNSGGAPPKKFKMRKWWVNQLKGRPLKVQFAEDDQQRYKKRFGKDRPKDSRDSKDSNRQRGGDRPERQFRSQQSDKKRERQGKFVQEEAVVERKEASDKPYTLQDLDIARRSGAVTKSMGKKTVFE